MEVSDIGDASKPNKVAFDNKGLHIDVDSKKKEEDIFTPVAGNGTGAQRGGVKGRGVRRF